MKKKGIISLSIIVVLIVLTGVLFGTVFCLRKQNVVVLGDNSPIVSKEDILKVAKLKNGQSIFMIDKETAINNIESEFPEIKVIQIKTTSIDEIKIYVRARHEMFYTEFNDKYYVLDEDLKVLRIIEESEEGQASNEPTNLTQIENGVLNINSSTKICDFVGSDYQKKTTYELCKAVTNNVKTKQGENKEYYTRADMCDILKVVEFEEFKTFNKIIITTKYGVKLDIENPTKNLADKINICFSTIRALISEGDNREQSGTIKIYYDLEGMQKNIYIP